MLLSSGQPGGYVVHHEPELTAPTRARSVGRARLRCRKPVTAGSPIRAEFELTVGERGLPQGGRISIAWRWPLDFGDLQVTDPEGPEYLSAHVLTHRAEIEVRYHCVSGFNPWNHAIEVRVCRGSLPPGGTVLVTCSRWQAPTCSTVAARFLVAAQNEEGVDWRQMVDPAPIAVRPGPLAMLGLVAPSDAVVGRETSVVVRGTDRFGNPAALREQPQIAVSAGGPAARVGPAGPTVFAGAWRVPVLFGETGRAVLRARAGALGAVANPIRVHASLPSQRLLWGDLHAGQGDTGCGLDSLDHHFAFARDVAGLQFASQQANDHYVSTERWQEVQRITQRWHDDGRFVAFLGCEWSALTEDGGDRNLIFHGRSADLPRSGRFFTDRPADPTPDAVQAEDLHRRLAGREMLLNLHAGGRPTDLSRHAPELEPLFEVHSTHGTSDWFVLEAIRRGYRVGVTAGTDGVMGRPGACHPGRRLARNCRGGVTGLYAADATHQAIWEAFHARRCYGTTGERIRLWVEIDGTAMGGERRIGAAEPVVVRVAVDGTAAIEMIELLRGTEVVATARVAAVDPERLRLLWGGTQACGTARDQRVVWDGGLRVEGASIDRADPVRFESPYDRLQREGGSLCWRSATAGGHAGVVLSLHGGPARCRFESAPAAFSFAADAVMATPTRVPAGGVGCQVEVGPAPIADGPAEAQVELTDDGPAVGAAPVPYWVRVTQVDRSRAWSSPITVRPPQ